MIAEALKSLIELAQKAVQVEQPQIVEALCDDRRGEVAYVYGGEVAYRQRALVRKHKFATAASFVAAIHVECDNKLDGEWLPSVWVEDSSVVGLMDSRHDERFYLPLKRADNMDALSSLQTPKSFDQRRAIAFVRQSLGGEFARYVPALSEVVFDRSGKSAGKVGRDAESLGKSIEARVSGIGELPEFLIGRQPIFDPSIFDHEVPVTVACDALIHEEQFQFWLPTGEANRVLAEAKRQLAEYLRTSLDGTGVQIYVGSP